MGCGASTGPKETSVITTNTSLSSLKGISPHNSEKHSTVPSRVSVSESNTLSDPSAAGRRTPSDSVVQHFFKSARVAMSRATTLPRSERRSGFDGSIVRLVVIVRGVAECNSLLIVIGPRQVS